MKFSSVFLIYLFMLVLPGPSHAELTDGLVAYYPFNGNTNDESGNGHHGTNHGALLSSDIASNANSAYRFDGIDDYIEILDADSLDIGLSDYSISAWVKTTSPTNNGRIFSKGSSACITGYMLRLNGNQAHLENAYNQSCQVFLAGNIDIADDQWHFIVGVVNRSEGGFLYIDGQLDASQQIDTSMFNLSNDRNAWIGRNDVHGIEAFNGTIDELRIYNRVLTEAEIQQLYQQRAGTTIAQISNSSDAVIIASPIAVQSSAENSSQSNGFAVVTPQTAQTNIALEDSSLQVAPETLLLIHPPGSAISPVESPPVSTLVRGQIQPKAECKTNKDFIVHAVIGDVSVSCDNQRATAQAAEFKVTYGQTGSDGRLTVSVISGSVIVTDRKQQKIVLTAGQEHSIQAQVPRTSWVLPIENDNVYGGQENLLVWTAYPGASGYLLEYNLPEPVFSETNSSSIEFKQRTVLLGPNDFDIFDDLILFRVFIGQSSNNPIVEGRVFALDANGEIISNTVSSDAVTVSWK